MAITPLLNGAHAGAVIAAAMVLPAVSGVVPSGIVRGPGAAFGAIDVSWLGAMPGDFVDGFGDLTWFERIHVEPYYRDLGFVISAQTIPVYVWNASRFATATATGAEVRGDEGASLVSPPAFPLQFLPGRQRIFSLLISEDGAPQFGNQLVFQFPGVPEAEADFNLTGIRVIPFPIDPSGTITEGYGYLTRIITSHAEQEQRAALRSIPRRGWSFEFVLIGRDHRLAQSMLHGWGAQPFGLPIWYEETVLTSSASAGALSLSADTTLRDWDEFALLWASPHQWEAILIDSLNATTLTLGSALLANWPASTRLYPMRIARVDARQILERRGLETALMRVAFRGEDWRRA